MSAAENAAETNTVLDRLGVKPGMAIQEIGYDDDVDEDLREAIIDRVGDEFVEEDADEVVDMVLVWWREDDGDLVDALVDAPQALADNGVVWLLTLKAGRSGHVEPSDIAESAPIAGMSQTSSTSVGKDWGGTCLSVRKTG